MHRTAYSFVALALAFALVACGGGNGKVPEKAASDASSASSDSASESSSSATSANPSDPCSLLSQSEAEDAIGSKLKEAPKEESDPVDGTKGCRYRTSDASRTFAVDVFEQPAGKAFLDFAKENGKTLDSVGDGAVYDEEFHRIYVVKGDVGFVVVFTIGDLDDEQQAGTKIANAVVGNL